MPSHGGVVYVANRGHLVKGCDVPVKRVHLVDNETGIRIDYPRLDLARIAEVGTVGVETSLRRVMI